MRTTLRTLTLAVASFLLAACESQPTQVTLGSEETFDGLRQVKNSVAHRVWMRPGLDLSSYDSIMLQGAGIKYRLEYDANASTSRARRGQQEFPVSPANQERLREIAREAFTQELGNSERFKLTDTTGPNVLLIEAALTDVVSFVPPEPVGRGDVFLSRIGAATLVVQVADSQTRATLARVVDRRAAQPISGGIRSSRPANTAEVRRLMQRWARQLRTGLDNLHDQIPK